MSGQPNKVDPASDRSPQAYALRDDQLNNQIAGEYQAMQNEAELSRANSDVSGKNIVREKVGPKKKTRIQKCIKWMTW
jgi:hypothetical protein